MLALASISYLSAITSLLLINRHAYFKSALLFLSFIIPLTAAWFIILQALILKSFCSQCCVIHGIAVLASLLSLLYISRTPVPEPRKHSLLTNRTFIFILSAIALTTFVYLQASSPETKQYKQSAVALQINTNNNKIDLYAGKITLSKSELPYLGTHSPDTESPFSIILTDYTCPHCVTYLKELNSKAQVGSPTLYYLPAYHNANARELHRVMLTVWKMDKQVYAQLLDEILENTISLDYHAVTQRADKLLGGSLTLYMKSSMEWTHSLLEKGKKLQDLNLQLASAGALPQTIIAGELYEGSLPYDTLLKKIQHATYTQQNNGSSDPQHKMSGEIKRPSSDAPLVAERTKVDLGRVTKGQKKPGVFTIRNTSDKPIIVKKIDTSCGCIITDKSPRTVEPGEIPFTLTFNKNLSKSSLTEGSQIISINSIPVSSIIEALLPYLKGDGNNDGKRLIDLELTGLGKFEAFDIYFPLLFPPNNSTYDLEIKSIDKNDSQKIKVSTVSRTERFDLIEQKYGKQPATYDDLWNFEILNKKTAYLQLGTFVTDKLTLDWKKFLAKAFDEVKSQNISNLIIDIRGNEGGADEVNLVLANYLASKPIAFPEFRQLLTYEKVSDDMRPYLKTWDKGFYDRTGKVKDLNNGFYTWKKDRRSKPISQNKKAFAGNVYLLVNAANSSATFFLATGLQENKIATIIGTETGGNRKGTNGGNLFFLRLPNSKIEIDVPLIGYYPLVEQPDKGLTPDIIVTSTLEDIKNKKDVVLEKAIEISNQK